MEDNTASLNVWQRLARRIAPVAYREARDLNGPGGGISFVDWAKSFKPGGQVTYAGQAYQAYSTASLGGSTNGYYYDGNAVVFACEANRLLLFSEARFQFQQLVNGRPGDLFGTPALAVLEEPWVGASTRDLLVQAELDIFQYGNSYWIRDPQQPDRYLLRLDPCKVKILTEAAGDDIYGYAVGQRLLAYVYMTKDAQGHDAVVVYEPDMVAHYKPYPDKTNRFIGTSWLTACLSDVESDASLTAHKQSTVDNGAKLGYVVSLDAGITPEQFDHFVNSFRANHEGPENAGRTLFLGGGADIKTVSQTMEDLSFKAVQGAGETRIAACAGVPPVIVGLSEGLSSATYSNYSQARRRLVDGTMRPLWGFFASAMESLVVAPNSGARLWYDDRDIPFLREDVMDQAQIMSTNASTVRTFIDAGFNPDAALAAVGATDLSRLKGTHSGLYSVQLQPPLTSTPPVRMTLSLGEIQHRVADGWQVLELEPAVLAS
jgi:HK97 family phage portal protein